MRYSKRPRARTIPEVQPVTEPQNLTGIARNLLLCGDAEEKAAGLLAKKFVEDALHVGGTYTLTTKEKGKFGRYLGVIMLSDRTSINAVLVTEHLAVPYHGQSKQEIEDAHATNYEILKDKGLL